MLIPGLVLLVGVVLGLGLVGVVVPDRGGEERSTDLRGLMSDNFLIFETWKTEGS